MDIELATIGQLLVTLANCTIASFGNISEMTVLIYTDLAQNMLLLGEGDNGSGC